MNWQRHLYYVLDVNHRPVPATLHEWGIFFENLENRLVNWTQVTSQITVSTVFLGVDYRYFGKGPPLLFETLIFGGGPLDQMCWRYLSWDDAEAGHQAAIRKARANLHSETIS